MKLAPSLHRIGSSLVNSYLVEDGGLVTIIDAGLPGYWSDLPNELAAMGRSLDDVRAVVLPASRRLPSCQTLCHPIEELRPAIAGAQVLVRREAATALLDAHLCPAVA